MKFLTILQNIYVPKKSQASGIPSSISYQEGDSVNDFIPKEDLSVSYVTVI